MKYGFTNYNLSLVKTTFSDLENQELVFEIISILLKINFDNVTLNKSYIDVLQNKNNNTEIEFNLVSESSISINICICDNFIDMIIDNKTSVYEMFKVYNKNVFLNSFKKWFDCNIIASSYVKFGFIFVKTFENSQGEILFKNSNYFYSNELNSNCNQKIFKAWIKN